MFSDNSITWPIRLHRGLQGFTILVVVLTFVRAFFGVDFTDEAFYIALPYRFALGDIPFRDEIAMQQTAAFIFYWPIKLYTLLTQTTDGIVLFGRMVFFAATCLVSLFTYRLLRPRLRSLGLWSALVLLMAPVLPIPNLSYNTGAQLFLVAALVSAFHALESQKNWMWFYFGVFISLTTISYPPLVVVAFLLTLVFFAGFLRSGNTRAMGFLVSGVLVLAIPILIGTFVVGWDRIEWAYQFAMATKKKGGGLSKLLLVSRQMGANAPLFLIFFYPLSAVVLSWRKDLRIYLQLLFSLLVGGWIISTLLSGPIGWVNPKMTIFGLAMTGPSAFLMGNRNGIQRSIIFQLWLPSALAGFVTSWTSSLGLISFYVGGTFAAVSTLILIGQLIPPSSSSRARVWLRACTFFPIALFALLTCLMNYSYVYRDSRVTKLNQLIRSGPYAGLLTNRKRKVALDALSPILSRLKSEQKVIFYDDFPAGYLFSSTRVGHCSIWSVTGNSAHRKMYLPCIRQLSGSHVQSVKIKFNPNRPVLGKARYYKDPFEKGLRKVHQERVIENDHYVLRRLLLTKPVSITSRMVSP